MNFRRDGGGSLVQELFDGPLDIVGDVHGEIDALRALMRLLGYDEEGGHPEGRRLVFLGDLTDRGPDSPAVVDLVRALLDAGRAQCVLGNHDLNILRGKTKYDNSWFFGAEFRTAAGALLPQVLADAATRERTLALFRSLPLALEREGLRVVHACWQPEMIEVARDATDVAELYQRHRTRIDQELAERGVADKTAKVLARQNGNPVKVITSGLEERATTPIEAAGRVRHSVRVHWWRSYEDPQLCVFGHYSTPCNKRRESSQMICVDYSVGQRPRERLEPDFMGIYRKTALAAVRLPERVVFYDDGRRREWRG